MKHRYSFLIFLIVSLTILPSCTTPQKVTAPEVFLSPTFTIHTPSSIQPSSTPDAIIIDEFLEDIPKPSSQTIKPDNEPLPKDSKDDTVNLPSWVFDPSINVLLYNTRSDIEDIDNLFLVNGSTFEVFILPTIEEIFSYFWSPDGSEIGIVTKDWQLILVNIHTGKVSRMPEEDKLIWYAFGNGGSQIAINAPDSPGKIFLFPGWFDIPGALSSNGLFLAERNYDDNTTLIINLDTNEQFPLQFKQDQPFNLKGLAWSPIDPYLAEIVTGKDSFMGNYEEIPEFTLRIFNTEGHLIAKYQNITSPNWSPDGTQFLYPPLNKNTLNTWSSPPCIYDRLTDQTKCFNDLANKNTSIAFTPYFTHLAWLPGQTMFAYNYFKYDHDIDLWDRGICFVTIASGREHCILTELHKPHLGIINFELSSDANSLFFLTNDTGPITDDLGSVQMGIADVKTGEYLILTEVGETPFYPSPPLWRP
jgi:WD40-like Beta Propeller Repeat